ncbi:FAD-dependent oxidoreductase [Candidatus Woesearchaeota archaeon]|nr:FAD-dependent oxidoreductase [Candidatus Woesearchaeota archaeon]
MVLLRKMCKSRHEEKIIYKTLLNHQSKNKFLMKRYDVIIIGAGAAGLTAAIYTCRKKLSTLVLSVDIGGQTSLTNHIENYPGVDACPGPDLMNKFKQQAESFGAEVILDRVTKVDKNKNIFTVTTANNKTFETRALILTFGKVHRSLNIPGEAKFLGRGVSTCVTCDAPLFKNKTVAVIGGGNSAVEGAVELAEIGAKQVYLVHRRNEFRADEITVEKARLNKKIELVLNHIPTEIKGDKFVTSIIVKDASTQTLAKENFAGHREGETKEIPVNGIFIEIGYEVDTGIVKHLVKLTDKNEIVTDNHCKTTDQAIFAAGDVTTTPYKQTVISAGEGAVAALSCHKYLTGGKESSIDWEVKKK